MGFVDCDDGIAPTHFEMMMRQWDDSADIVLNTIFFNRNNVISRQVLAPSFKRGQVPPATAIEYCLGDTAHCYGGYLFNKLFSLKLINESGLRFDERIGMCEDILFSVQYLARCRQAILLDDPTYTHIIQAGSITNSPHSSQWFTDIILAEESMRTSASGLSRELDSALDVYTFSTLPHEYLRAVMMDDRSNHWMVVAREYVGKELRGTRPLLAICRSHVHLLPKIKCMLELAVAGLCVRHPRLERLWVSVTHRIK